jgi:hypothetical protein
MNNPHKRFNRIGRAVASLAEDLLSEHPSVSAKLALAFEEIDKAHHDYMNSVLLESSENFQRNDWVS